MRRRQAVLDGRKSRCQSRTSDSYTSVQDLGSLEQTLLSDLQELLNLRDFLGLVFVYVGYTIVEGSLQFEDPRGLSVVDPLLHKAHVLVEGEVLHPESVADALVLRIHTPDDFVDLRGV